MVTPVMRVLDKLRSLLGIDRSDDKSDEPATCVGCGRPVGSPGELCEACDSTEGRRFGH